MEQKLLNKICGTCKTLKLIGDFNFKDKKKGKLQSFCRDCHAKYHFQLNDEDKKKQTEIFLKLITERN